MVGFFFYLSGDILVTYKNLSRPNNMNSTCCKATISLISTNIRPIFGLRFFDQLCQHFYMTTVLVMIKGSLFLERKPNLIFCSIRMDARVAIFMNIC